MNSNKLDLKVMAWGGGALLMLAGLLFWSELQIPFEGVVAVLAALAAIVSFVRIPRERPLAGPIALLAVTLLGGAWFLATKAPILLMSLAICLVASAVTVWRMHRPAISQDDRLHLMLLWYGLVASVVVASGAFYFQFFTLGFAHDEVARRLALTLAWVAGGVALIHVAYRRGEPVVRDAGVGLLAVAVGKLLLYDTVHLSGSVRIAGLTAAGLLLLLGAWATAKMPVIQRGRS